MQCADPVTGSSGTPARGAKNRETKSASVPGAVTISANASSVSILAKSGRNSRTSVSEPKQNKGTILQEQLLLQHIVHEPFQKTWFAISIRSYKTTQASFKIFLTICITTVELLFCNRDLLFISNMTNTALAKFKESFLGWKVFRMESFPFRSSTGPMENIDGKFS